MSYDVEVNFRVLKEDSSKWNVVLESLSRGLGFCFQEAMEQFGELVSRKVDELLGDEWFDRESVIFESLDLIDENVYLLLECSDFDFVERFGEIVSACGGTDYRYECISE